MTVYAPIITVATVANQDFGLPWPILARSDVTATLDGVPANITWVSDNLIELPNNPGASVVIQRTTAVDNPAVSFKGGAIASKDLNKQVSQLLFRAQELPYLVGAGIQIPGPPGPPGEPGPPGDGTGDVLGPDTNTDNFVPQWSGNDSKALKGGRHIGVDAATDILDRAAGDSRFLQYAQAAPQGLAGRLSIAGAGKSELALTGNSDGLGGRVFAGTGNSLSLGTNVALNDGGSGVVAKWSVGGRLVVGSEGSLYFISFSGATIGQSPPDLLRLRYTPGGAWDFQDEKVVLNYVPSLATHATNKAYVDSVAGGAPVLSTVTLNSDLGTANLAGLHNKVVKLVSDHLDDPNIWNFSGMSLGQITTLLPQENFGLIFKNIDGVAQHIMGNWEGVDREDGTGPNTATLPVNERDTLEVICVSLSPYQCRVFVKENQFVSRPLTQIAGSSQDPDEAFYALGTLGKWSPTKGIPYGDFLMYTSGTVRKPIMGGLALIGVGDTCPIFMEVYQAEGQDEGEGLQDPQYAVPWTDPNRIGTGIRFRQRVADAGGKLVICDTPIAPGAPGSLNQGISGEIDFYTHALPTMTSTPGGLTLRACRPDINCSIDVLTATHTGTVLIHGQAALEGYGTFAEATSGGRLTEDNGDEWHAPALYTSRNGTFYGDMQFFSVPLDKASNVRQYGSLSFRRQATHSEGVDFAERTDENMFWWMPVSSNTRLRGVGHRPGEYGYFTKGEAASDVAQFQGGRYTFTSGSQSKTINLRSGQWGSLRITLTDGHYADFGVSADSGVTRLGYTTDSSKFSISAGDTTKWRATLVGGDLVITNPSTGGASCFVQLQH